MAPPRRARIRPIESMSACSRALSSARSRAWSRSSSSSTFLSSSNASLSRPLASSSLLGLDFALEVDRHALEISDHAFDLGNPSALLVDLKFLQADQRFA
jgi:hypothetical protein